MKYMQLVGERGTSPYIKSMASRKLTEKSLAFLSTLISYHSTEQTTGFATKDHDLHRLRRAPVAKFFSHGMIERLEGDIHSSVHKLCDKLLAQSGKEAPIDVAMAYSCFTSDTISAYCFGETFGLLDQESWSPNFREATLALLKPVFILRFFPFLKALRPLSLWYVSTSYVMRQLGESNAAKVR
jgi:cytochrome P450